MLDPEDSAKLAAFLAPSRIAVVGTISPSGMPQLTPNWYVYQDGRRVEASVRATAFESSTRVKNITPHGRVKRRTKAV